MQRQSKVYPPTKPTVVVDWALSAADRRSLRHGVAEKWLEEQPFTNYRYNVEQCSNGSRIYLLRPTFLNKGFDFQVNVEGFRSAIRSPKGPTKEMPSHKDVIHDLRLKVSKAPKRMAALFDAVAAVHDCVEPTAVLRDKAGLEHQDGLPVDQLLLTLKWLFIEQDLTYWAQRGRDMLMRAIEKDVFGLPED